MRTAILLIALCTTGAANASGIPECQIRILHPVVDDLGNHWAEGELLPTDLLRRDGNAVFYCAHGGSCTPALAGGRHVAQLANCRPGKPIGNGDYRLDPDPGTMGAVDTRRFRVARRVEDALSALGFSNAAAGSWSSDYADNPVSPNGRLVGRALAGSKSALAAMRAKLQ